MMDKIRASLIGTALLMAAVAAAPCNTCGGAGEMPIRRDATFAKARAAQAELSLWCSYCAALGLYADDDANAAPADGDSADDSTSDSTKGPCPDCSSRGLEGAPAEAAAALDVHVREWWHDHQTGSAIFLYMPIGTFSTDCGELALGKDAPAFARQRAELAKQIPGKEAGRGKNMGRHERAHMWMERIADSYRFCNDTCGIAPADAASVHQASYLFNFILFGGGGDGSILNQRLGQLYRRGDGNLSYADASSSVGSDDSAWARLTHNVGHIWAERLYGGQTHKGVQGWLISGMKLHSQLYFTAGLSMSVASETSTSGAWGGPKRLKGAVFKLVEKEKANFAAMLAKQWEALDIQDQMLAWSLLDFLSTASKPKLKELLRQLAVEQKGLADALRESHGWTLGMLEASWVQYVQTTYKGDERKTLPVRGYNP